MKILNFVLLVLLVVGCSKSTDSIVDCEEKILNDLEMVKYEDQDLECKFYLDAYHWHGRSWFILNNNCADIAGPTFDCEGNDSCDFDCENFQRDAKFLGIIGISK